MVLPQRAPRINIWFADCGVGGTIYGDNSEEANEDQKYDVCGFPQGATRGFGGGQREGGKREGYGTRILNTDVGGGAVMPKVYEAIFEYDADNEDLFLRRILCCVGDNRGGS